MYHNKQDDKTTQIRSGTISLRWHNIGVSHVGRVTGPIKITYPSCLLKAY